MDIIKISQDENQGDALERIRAPTSFSSAA
jgi:hypothetical protein